MSDTNTDHLATQTTELSPIDSTRTSEPAPKREPARAALPDPHRVALAQPRDPERYQLIAEHGRGGLGRVSRAHDQDLGRDVAIKELLSRDHIGEVRFLREALITARLEHPGIVPVHEAGRWPDGTPFYAMKLVSGRPLRELIMERTTIEDRIGLLHHVIAVADAIAYAHNRNIIHRDLKPSNVIVGDFGETIVIDWGLAKDLTTTEAPTQGSGPFRSSQNDGLTAVGSVLGTPAYMAPEQLRGEPADQRADVFAIGTMLYELCSIERSSAIEPPHRHRLLRRAGIDEDLVAIIDKALEPDPARRYRDAGALAADLKAFKSGARIAARRYSLLAMLAHWIRRHRTLALSIAAAVVVAVAGIAVYVRNIAVERDRADTALARVEATTTDLVREHAALTLRHAQVLLMTDPSAAIDTLATYQGADRDRANQLRAEAIGRGVARVRAAPHTDNILWAEGMPDGAIVSLGLDGAIMRTAPDQTSTVLASDGTRRSAHAYARSRHLLAYACNPADLCLLDVLHGARLAPPPELRGADVIGVAFSPSEGRLAVLSRTGVLRVFDIAAARWARHLEVGTDGASVVFVDEEAMVVGTAAGIQLVRITGRIQALALSDCSYWDTSASAHQMVLATTQGQGLVIEIAPLRVARRETLCHGAVSGVRFVTGQRTVAYACREGTVGFWDLERGGATPRTHLDGHADMLAAAGDYLVVAGGNGALVVLDRHTDLITTYKGHGFRLITITPPTSEYPFFLSADVRGGLRAWPLPARFARVVADVHTQFMSAIFNERAAAVIATTLRPELTMYSAAGGLRSIPPHATDAIRIEGAAGGERFATYGFSDVVELWSVAAMAPGQTLHTHHGSVSHLELVAGTDEVVTAGQDGRLVRWTSGEPSLIARFEQPIATFALGSAPGSAVVATADGALWRVAGDGRALALGPGGVKVTRMQALPDAASICVGYADGAVVLIDTWSWQQARLLKAADAILDIAVTGDGRTIAVASDDGLVHVGVRHGATWSDARATWVVLTALARRIALTPDGLLVAVCTDGIIWIWSLARRTWLSLPTGTADPSTVVVTRDGEAAAALDNQGRIIWIDLAGVRKAIDVSQEH